METLKQDSITYLEMARIAMATVPDTIVEEMDMSDDEFVRLRDQLQEHMEGK
jgi:predicted metal-binding transcription factor (methanogenesis marker protein 9)